MSLPIYFILGPTGSGKSAVAVELARAIGAEIVSADAYQVYRELPILTASPTQAEREGVPHHMLEFLSVSEPWDAAEHYHRAMGCVRDIQARQKPVIITGGSGLYVKFLSHGMSEAPPGDETLRASFQNRTLEDLYAELQQIDPEGAAMTAQENRRYVERNLEIVKAGGKPLSYWKQNWQHEPLGKGWYISRDVSELDARIALRAKLMFEQGVKDEVAALGDIAQTCSETAARTLGLSIISDHLRGYLSEADAIQLLALRTRQYAKRQRTWLKREQWLHELSANADSTSFDLANTVLSAL